MQRVVSQLEDDAITKTVQKHKDYYSMNMLVCGEVLLIGENWRVCITCSFCGIEWSTLEELLTHSLGTHFSDVSAEQMAEVLGGIKKERAEDNKHVSVPDTCDTLTIDEIEPEEQATEVSVLEILDEGLSTVEENSETYYDYLDWSDSTQCSSSNFQPSVDFEDIIFQPFKAIEKPDEINQQKQKKSKQHRTCPVCGKMFDKSDRFKAHMNRHEGNKPYACSYCSSRFTDKTNCKVHEYRHLGIKPHKCEICKKAFTTAPELRVHIRSHTGERPYKCDQCDSAFTNSTHLLSHRRRHTKDRRYLCTICGKRFYDVRYLRHHQATHTSERAFACTQCKATFTLQSGLDQHLKIHSEIKKYVCKFCNKRFAQNAGLHSHIKTHRKKDSV